MPAADIAHSDFPHLFAPFALGHLKLRNRIAISGHHAGWFVDRGLPSDELVAYLEERAKGGVGLFVIGATTPEAWPGCVENIGDEIVPRYAKLVEAGHRNGTAVFAQLFHPGYRPLPGPPIVAPAPSAAAIKPAYRDPPRANLSVVRLNELSSAFATAAGRAAAGGIDGVELHAHESFLHAQLLNPLWNTRTDEYGGSLENRLRFIIQTLRMMRKAIGPAIPLGIRLKLDDVLQRGMNAEDYHQAIGILEATGLVDYLSFTGGDGRFHHGPMPRPEGEWLALMKQMRRHTALPLMHAGRINTPEMAEQALAHDAMDIVCMTKAHIADPHFAKKVFENRLDDIRYCTRCLQSCHGNIAGMTCVYNPLTGREATWSKLARAERKRRIVIVGGGPAGMECAITAAARGHDVIVLERESRVGGQIWMGASSPLRKNWARIAEFYDRQSRNGPFDVRLSVQVSEATLRDLLPDAIVIATGSRSSKVNLPGGAEAHTVEQALNGALNECKRVTIFDREGFNRPLVVTDYLSSRRIGIDFVTPLPTMSPRAEEMNLDEMIDQFATRGVRFYPGFTIDSWNQSEVQIRSVQTADEQSLAADAVVAAVGAEPVNDLAAVARGIVKEVYVIGDANIPQTVEHATYQGARIGRLL